MQTFIVDYDLSKSASYLDNKRLGKQRVEALQILNDLLIKPSHWNNHPAIRMWIGYAPYLVQYTKCICDEWVKRGFKNIKCSEKLCQFINLVDTVPVVVPFWITDKFILAHRSNLIRKKSEHYKQFWQDIPDDLPYVWTV